MASIPFELGRIYFMPDCKLGGLLVVAEDERGVIRRSLEISSKFNAKLIFLHYILDQKKREKVFTIFYDLTGCSVSLEKLADEIKAFTPIKKVMVIEQQIEGFIADTTTTNLTLSGVRGLFMRSHLWRALVNRVREKFGSAGEAFLYYTGVDMGISGAKEHLKMARVLNLREPEQIIKTLGASVFSSVGLGFMQIDEFNLNPPYSFISVYDNFECEVAPASSKPYSQLIRGIIAGYLKQVLSIEVSVEEIECLAKGDPCCRFECKAKK
ncbi:MAG: V4R domain-containing protein [Nitrososphaerales archaeon]